MSTEALTQILVGINTALIAWLLGKQYQTYGVLSSLVEKVSNIEKRVASLEDHKEELATRVHDLDRRVGKLEVT